MEIVSLLMKFDEFPAMSHNCLPPAPSSYRSVVHWSSALPGVKAHPILPYPSMFQSFLKCANLGVVGAGQSLNDFQLDFKFGSATMMLRNIQ